MTVEAAGRHRLLAPQLEHVDTWTDLANTVDRVFAELGIESGRQGLKLLRSPVDISLVTGNVEGDVLRSITTLDRHERATLVRTADLLGFQFHNRQLFDTEDYLRLCLFLGQYYDADKGTARFADFMGFIGNAPFKVFTTWTSDYHTFRKDGDPLIGTPVYEGGTWYPTTHVVLQYSLLKYTGIPRAQIEEFFYYFANINVVLESIELIDESDTTLGLCMSGTTEVWY